MSTDSMAATINLCPMSSSRIEANQYQFLKAAIHWIASGTLGG